MPKVKLHPGVRSGLYSRIGEAEIRDRSIKQQDIDFDAIFDEHISVAAALDGAKFAVGSIGGDKLDAAYEANLLLRDGTRALTGNLNVANFQLSNLRAENLASDPTPGTVGRLFFNTTDGVMRYDDGVAIKDFGVSALSALIIDTTKNWGGFGVTNMGSLSLTNQNLTASTDGVTYSDLKLSPTAANGGNDLVILPAGTATTTRLRLCNYRDYGNAGFIEYRMYGTTPTILGGANGTGSPPTELRITLDLKIIKINANVTIGDAGFGAGDFIPGKDDSGFIGTPTNRWGNLNISRDATINGILSGMSDLRIPTAATGSPAAGSMYFDAATNTLYAYNGTAWVSVLLS